MTLIVYDMLGKEIATIVKRSLGAGYHSVVWNIPTSGISSGVYFTKLMVTDASSTKLLYSKVTKMLLLK